MQVPHGRASATGVPLPRRRLTATVLSSLLACVSAFGQATTLDDPSTPQPGFEPQRQRDDAGLVIGPPRVGWWNDAVFYEIFVRSFHDSTTGPLAGDGIGDLRGLIEKLDYLNDGDPVSHDDLGVTGIWLMPIHSSPSYHGYDITDYQSVNPQYGTLADLRDLMTACHQRGIRVILDLVLNHISSRHPWFQSACADPASPKRDWFIWSDEDPAYRGPWGQRVWHPLRDPRGATQPTSPQGPYFYGLFGRHMPDLNFRNEAVGREMLGAVRYWLREETGGVDGFRLDAIRHLIEDGRQQDNTPETHRWLQTFFREYKNANPQAVTVGEVWSSTELAARYVGDQMDLTFEFDLAEAITQSASTGLAAPVRAAQDKILRHYPPNQYGRFLSNHDQVRIATRLGSEPGKVRVAAAMLLTGPGVPFLYYAEEVGQPGPKPDPNLRTPMPWTETAEGFSSGVPWHELASAPPGTNVAAQRHEPSSLLNYYRRLIRLRNENACLRSGSYATLDSSSTHVYSFLRWLPGANSSPPTSAALVVIHLGGHDEPVEVRAAFSPLRGRWSGVDVLSPRGGALPALRIDASAESGTISAVPIADLSPFESRVYLLSPAP